MTGSGSTKAAENGAEEGDTEEDEEEAAMETAGPSDTKPPSSSPAKSPRKSPTKKPITSGKSPARKSPSKLAGSKRPREEREKVEGQQETSSPVAKKGKRLMCKYGPKCYQANPEHKEAYDHPWVRLSSPLSGLSTTCVY